MRTNYISIFSLVIIFMLAVLMSPDLGLATNGMNMIGTGAASSAMGGTTNGRWDDPNSMNGNPAGIASISSNVLGFGIGLLMPAVHYQNELNDVDGESELFPLPSISYVNGNSDRVWNFGLGIYAQGGMGATYQDVQHNVFRAYDNDPRTQDGFVGQEYHSNIAYLKAVPTFAWNCLLDEKLAIGVGLNIGYAMMEMNMPYSISPAEKMIGQIPGMGGMTYGQMFAGPPDQGGLGYDEVTAYADLGEGVTATGIGAKIGFQYRVNDNFSLGINYTSKATLTFSGDAEMDMSSQFGDAYERMVGGALQQMGLNPATATDAEVQLAQQGVNHSLSNMGIDMSLGMVADYDAEIKFSWPQEFGFGVAFQANDKLRLAVDFRWINWKAAMEKFTMNFTNGTNANVNAMMGSADLELEMPLNWEDQMALGFGLEYLASDQLLVRAGYNYGANPVPANTVIPVFPAVVEGHVTLGFGYQFTDQFGIDIGYEMVMPVAVEAGESLIANEYLNSTSELGENIIHLSTLFKF